MAGPDLIVAFTGEKVDPLVDGTGTTKLKRAVGTASTGVGPIANQGVATHQQGDTFGATDPLTLAGAIDPGGLAQPLNLDGSGALITSPGSVSAAAQLLDSATGAGGAPTDAVLAAVALKTTHISGFQVTGLGATGASGIVVTVTDGVWTLDYALAVPAGVDLSIVPLIVRFDPPLAASAVNSAITVDAPDFGAGNTLVAVAAQGFAI